MLLFFVISYFDKKSHHKESIFEKVFFLGGANLLEEAMKIGVALGAVMVLVAALVVLAVHVTMRCEEPTSGVATTAPASVDSGCDRPPAYLPVGVSPEGWIQTCQADKARQAGDSREAAKQADMEAAWRRGDYPDQTGP